MPLSDVTTGQRLLLASLTWPDPRQVSVEARPQPARIKGPLMSWVWRWPGSLVLPGAATAGNRDLDELEVKAGPSRC
jgi:hypothetical protein